MAKIWANEKGISSLSHSPLQKYKGTVIFIFVISVPESINPDSEKTKEETVTKNIFMG